MRKNRPTPNAGPTNEQSTTINTGLNNITQFPASDAYTHPIHGDLPVHPLPDKAPHL